MYNSLSIFIALFGLTFAVLSTWYGVRRKRGGSRKKDFVKVVGWSFTCSVLFLIVLNLMDHFGSHIQESSGMQSDLIQNPSCGESDSILCILVANFKMNFFLHKEAVVEGSKVMRLIYQNLTGLSHDTTHQVLTIHLDTIPYTMLPHIDTHEEAKEVGRLLQADMVIWGNIERDPQLIGPLKIEPKITIINQSLNAPSENDVGNFHIEWSSIGEWDFYSEDINQPVALANLILGLGYLVKKDIAYSIKYLQQGIVLSGKGKGADMLYYYLAHALTEKNFPYDPDSSDASNAIKALQTAIEIAPNNKNYYNDLGLLWDIRQEYQSADSAFKKALWLDSSFVTAQSNLALLYYEQGQDSLSIAMLNKAIGSDSSLSTAYLNLSKVYFYQSKLTMALNVINIAPVNDPNAPLVYNTRGAIYLSLDSIDQAIINLRKAIELEPKYAEANMNLGVVLAKKRDYTTAEDLYEKALMLNPKLKFVYYNIAALYAQQGKSFEAIKILDEHFHDLEKPYDQLGNHSVFYFLEHDTDFDQIRHQQIFRDFIKRHPNLFQK